MGEPLATVIVPVYNVAAYLPACIASIRAQSQENLQILLVDDGSTDGSSAICDACAAEDTRIQVIHKENGGVCSARNAGLAQARGKYIYFVDGDDLLAEDAVRRSIEALESGPYDACIWSLNILENGTFRYRGRGQRKIFLFPSERKRARFLCRWFLSARLGWEVWIQVFRREIIERHGLRFGHAIFAEDMDFTFRYLLHCRSLCLLPAPLYVYRIRDSSVMQTIPKEKQFAEISRLLQQQRRELADDLPEFCTYEGVALAAWVGEPAHGEAIWRNIAGARGYLAGCAEWEALLADARTALADAGVRRLCGCFRGALVRANFKYLLDGDAV